MDVRDIVLASFVYSGSDRQSAIMAAATSPINVELVTQLVGYLDDKYTIPREQAEARSTDSRSVDTTDPTRSGGSGDFDASDISFDDGSSLASMFGDAPSADETNTTSESEDAAPPEAELDDTPSTPSTPEAEPEVESNTTVPVTFESISASIQTTLNSADATQGVRAARVVGNELWIYYGDDINLNAVMESVIDAVPGNIVEFNRLARSHNAIVFTNRGATCAK